MAKSISFFEYEKKDFTTLDMENLFDDDIFISGFETFLKKTGIENALTFGRHTINTTCWVGVLKYKHVQIEILPKLLAHSYTGDKRDIILKNLLYMLSYTKKLTIKDGTTAILSSVTNPFLDVLVRSFANSLFDALKRYSPKNYIVISDNINYFKGKLNVTANIRHNSINHARFFCEFDEFSENNRLNQLFLYVSKCLYDVSKDLHNKKLLQSIMNYYADIDFVPFYKKDLIGIQLTRNQTVFEMPLRLAKMFIEQTSVDMSKNKFDNIAMIWDMNALFEEFIYEFINRHKIELGLSDVSYQRGKRLLRSMENNRCYANTFVDICITRATDNAKLILDTKYKDNYGNYGEFINSDVFQVTTYCRLHNSNHAILLYPATDGTRDDIHPYKLNVDTGITDLNIKTARLDIGQDLSSAVIQFEMIKKLKTILDT